MKTTVTAILETRCGCARSMSIGNPPLNEIKVALRINSPFSPERTISETGEVEYRIFLLYKIHRHHNEESEWCPESETITAYYREV